jgi:hypothetical protein
MISLIIKIHYASKKKKKKEKRKEQKELNIYHIYQISNFHQIFDDFNSNTCLKVFN